MAHPIKHGKKWRIRWLDGANERCSEVFTDYNVAARELRKRELESDEIRRGVRDAPPIERTMGDLFDHWLEHRAPQKRSEEHDASIIRAHLRPAFGKVPLREINQGHVDVFEGARAHLDKKTVANHLTLLISCLRLAHDMRWLATMPRIRKPKIRINKSVFRYLRSNDEVQRFLTAARAEKDPVVFVIYITALFTGMRQGELAGLRWAQVDLDRRFITVHRSFDGDPTKSDAVRHVPILDALLPVLKDWRAKNPLDVVFPSQVGTELARSGRIFQEVLHRVLRKGGFPERLTKKGKVRGYIVFHDLRHSFASHWMMRGGDLYKLQKILGHESEKMTQRYAHLNPNAFVEDFGRFGGMDAAPAAPQCST